MQAIPLRFLFSAITGRGVCGAGPHDRGAHIDAEVAPRRDPFGSDGLPRPYLLPETGVYGGCRCLQAAWEDEAVEVETHNL